MAIQVSTIPAAQNGGSHAVVERPSAGFHPSVWGDYFVKYNSASMVTIREEQLIEELVKVIKRKLADADDLGKLDLIDRTQRLGIAYKFEKEIKEILQKFHDSCSKSDAADYGHDMRNTALLFRLLRQEGYRIPACHIFNKFKDSDGKFSQALTKDVRGLLSLYEASNFRVHGENILEEALTFSVHHLQSALENDHSKTLSPGLVEEVKHALKHSIHKGLTRLEAWHYIRFYEQDASHDEVLLRLAKLDFNFLQKLHQKELSEISRWWIERINCERNFPYARDRIAECYLWMLGVYFEPEYALARNILAKIIALASIMDDTYDAYGTSEELQLLTDAIDRWDMDALDQLPEYMQVFYKELLDTYREFEELLAKQGRSYRFKYAKQSIQHHARVYFKEATWFHQNHVPTIDEYMPLALETTGYGLLPISSFIGMGDVATEDAFEWLLSDPKIIRGAKIVCRLMDDIVSHKLEQERGHVASAVECYAIHHGMSEEESTKLMWRMIEDAWKDINEEMLRPTPVEMPLLMRILNLTRVMELLYKDKDRYTHAETETKDFVAALLVHPIPL
ncbi:hypothetical protein SAY86_028557 [Trapa natans]|uniref:Uncharacterized protein n=1 Tax=Trapa natans TaxID=22666 RepID=A0AAN7REA0_TRANT|nr:hypothetical protein SAY86_028557 [Trapa natans]